MQRIGWLCVLLVATLAGCSGGGGGSKGTPGTEDEPNDDIEEATDLGGAGVHEVSGNACIGGGFGDDYFKATAGSAGTATLTLEWDETDEDDDLDVALLDETAFPVDQVDLPPASLAMPVEAGEILFVAVECWGGFEAVPYEGTLTVP